MTKEERRQILQMVADGKITAEDAEKLLDKLSQPEASPNRTEHHKSQSKYLYVLVEPKNSEKGERVKVKVPFSLLRAGINISGMIPEEARTQINSAMQEKGISFDINNINSENMEELLKALDDLEVNVESETETVNIYCE